MIYRMASSCQQPVRYDIRVTCRGRCPTRVYWATPTPKMHALSSGNRMMKSLYHIAAAIAFAVTVLIPGQVQAQAPDASQLIERLESRYNTLSALRAEFT